MSQQVKDRVAFLEAKPQRTLVFSLLFIMERPAAVLAAIDLAVLVDGIAGKGKRRPLSAFVADHGGAFSFLFRVVDHLFKLS